MSINIHIQKKDLWLLSAIVIFLVGVGYVIAYGGNQPSVHGHSAGEVEGTSLGAWTDKDSNGNNLAIDNVYKVTGDGFLIWTTQDQCCPCLRLRIGSTNPPNEINISHGRGWAGGGEIIAPIKKDYYWNATQDKINSCGDYTGAHYFRWIPFGNGVNIKQ